MSSQPWAALLSAVGVYAVVVASPGPRFLIVMRTSLAYGRLAGLATGAGLALGNEVYALLCLAALAAVLALPAWVLTAVKVAGSLYFVWFAWRVLRPRPPAGGSAPAIEGRRAFGRGFLIAITTPNSIPLFISLFAATVLPDSPAWVAPALLVLLLAVSLGWTSLMALLFSSAGPRALYQHHARKVDLAAGAALLALAAQGLWRALGP